jgi:hypothetical protein
MLLDPAEQAGMVRRLSDSGYSDESIAIVSGLSIELVRRILSEQRAPAGIYRPDLSRLDAPDPYHQSDFESLRPK